MNFLDINIAFCRPKTYNMEEKRKVVGERMIL